jgi:hypothetical protein
MRLHSFWGTKSMNENNDYIESRQHTRAKMHNIVIGILNSKEPETIGSITDISLGGVKYAYYELRMEPNKSPVHSIDLIAYSLDLLELPCKYVWDGEVETESHNKSTMIRQCGIQFGKLVPKQTFLLRKFIDICVSQGIKSLTSRAPISERHELPSRLFF